MARQDSGPCYGKTQTKPLGIFGVPIKMHLVVMISLKAKTNFLLGMSVCRKTGSLKGLLKVGSGEKEVVLM